MNESNWPVIVNVGLEESDILRVLRTKLQKIRVSSSTLDNTIIFPLSGVAFMVVPLQRNDVYDETNDYTSTKTDFETISKFTSLHKKCYFLAYAPLHGDKEMALFAEIQRKFLETRLQLLPVHNATEGVIGMLTIAKMLCKPTAELLFNRLATFTEVSTDVISAVLESIGLTPHQASVLQDGLGSLHNIASADLDQLLDCSLDVDTARMVLEFFHKPLVSPLMQAEA